MAVHAIISFLASFSLIFVYHLFLGIPSYLGDTIKQKKRDWGRKRKITWTAALRNSKNWVYYCRLASAFVITGPPRFFQLLICNYQMYLLFPTEHRDLKPLLPVIIFNWQICCKYKHHLWIICDVLDILHCIDNSTIYRW